MIESVVQSKIINFLNQKWYICIKQIKTNYNWVPDLLVLTWNNEHFWIEVKTESWKLSELQKYRIEKFKEIWDTVLVVYWFNDFLNKFDKKV